MLSRSLILAYAASAAVFVASAGGAGSDSASLDRQFATSVHPFVENYCVSCHGKEKAKAELDLTKYTTLDSVTRDHSRWAQVLEKLTAAEMPPEKAKRQPSEEERKAVVTWIQSMRKIEARRNAGDPGIVLARRLSNAEFDYTIRDLTGVDIRPTKEFPVDPANEAGFDNSGESLTMSPALLKKYLEAARQVTDYMVLTPQGFEFAPYPVVADTDRDRYSVNRIINFYQRQNTNYADYFEAAWRFKYRVALGQPKASLADIAANERLSAKYLATIWATLETREDVGPIAKLQTMWRNLSKPDEHNNPVARFRCEEMAKFVTTLRAKLVPEVPNLGGGGMHEGSQPMLLWKDKQWASNRTRYDTNKLQMEGMPLGVITNAYAGKKSTNQMAKTKAVLPDADLTIPADEKQRARYEADFGKFCAVFPDAFYISERSRTYEDPNKEKERGLSGRLLSAGFHSQTGYFRDDGPLCDLMLDDRQRQDLNQLWDNFFFMSEVAVRMHTSFLWFERSDSTFMMGPEFKFTRPEDKTCTDEAVLKRLAEIFENKARTNGANEVVLQAIRDHFDTENKNLRWLEKTKIDAIPAQLKAVQDFAERAFRRPLTQAERDGLVNFYRALRKDDDLGHEDALRDTIASVLMSPNFCYRVDLVAEGPSARPLPDYELASRLSYFLWASTPDQELLKLAAAGKLHERATLVAQARRMLQDPRAQGFATEFVGNWLDFRRFEQHNGVDRERFPSFNNDLREAMFQEPIRFALDVMQQDRSILDFLYAKDTFVNPPLAAHYGMPAVEGGSGHWVHVEHAADYGRGGLLPMAVFLHVANFLPGCARVR